MTTVAGAAEGFPCDVTASARQWRATASGRRECRVSRLQCRAWTTRPAGTTSPSESTGGDGHFLPDPAAFAVAAGQQLA